MVHDFKRARKCHSLLMTPGIAFLPSPQALFKLWGSPDKYPKDILTYTELVLDPQGQLVEMNRLPGGNEVRTPRSPIPVWNHPFKKFPSAEANLSSLCVHPLARWAWWPSK